MAGSACGQNEPRPSRDKSTAGREGPARIEMERVEEVLEVLRYRGVTARQCGACLRMLVKVGVQGGVAFNGACPKCRGTHIEPPRFFLAGSDADVDSRQRDKPEPGESIDSGDSGGPSGEGGPA